MNAGMSLLEVIVALAVLGVGLGGIIAGLGQAQRAAQVATRRSEAIVLAQGLLTQARCGTLGMDHGHLEPGGWRWRLVRQTEQLPGLTRLIVEVDYPLGAASGSFRLVGCVAARDLPPQEP